MRLEGRSKSGARVCYGGVRNRLQRENALSILGQVLGSQSWRR